MEDVENPEEQLKEFLLQVWGTEPAKVFLAQRNDDKGFFVLQPQEWPSKAEQISKYLWRAGHQNRDVYFSPALYKDEAESKHKENVKGSRVLWVDIDGDANRAWAKWVASGHPLPSARIASGSPDSEHWYWFLNSEENADNVEECNRRIAYFIGRDYGADVGCWSAEHVLRPPFTNNYKRGEENPVDFVSYDADIHGLSTFDSLPSVNHSFKETLELDADELPDVQDVIALYTWDEKHLDIFKNPPKKQGGRSDSMVRLAYYLAEVGANDQEIYAIIQDVDDRVKKFVGRTDRNRRLTEIVAKARMKYPYGQGMEFEQTNSDTKEVYGIKDLLNAPFKIEWLIDKLIPLNTTNYISAPPGIGKSRLALQLADCAVRGEQFLTWPIEKRVEKVMYLSFEMDGPMLKHFVESLSENMEVDDDLNERFLFYPLGQPISFDKPSGFQAMEALIKEYRPNMVFVDALGKMTFEEIGEVQAKTLNNNFQALTRKYQVTFFVIHHNRKDDAGKSTEKRPTMADVYGSQYVMSDASVGFSLWGQNARNMELVPIKTRAGMTPEPVKIDGTEFRFKVRHESHPSSNGHNVDTENLPTGGYFADPNEYSFGQ